MKEMVYSKEHKRELLDRGIYNNHEYFVISFGTHPCAYIKLNGENRKFADGVICHGGVTYNEPYLKLSEDETLQGDFIGWDYAHCGDFLGFDEEWCGGDKYTTQEIVYDCQRVIDELIGGE